ncbi:tetratricopeptide repeat protein [Cesiribacter andamanensis]|uniref:Putative O-linked N-acetylglucosamine transferase, SPINDLY family n=1 Tax=Cesiribacter andamanensis AMV16 TaxID=1279009 RepID=M7N3F5_9BACT|nr:tetratricopeptide repeat protein [Cesiribacter andamanensis]EMR03218.1 putative O-linked N-acetylglucosamine transferase, SPINDLY family [Cesiribacter andamanensis AMV16]
MNVLLSLAVYVVMLLQGSPASLLQEGKQQYQQRNLPAAHTAFTKAIEKDPSLVEAYFRRGLVKEKMNDLPGAEADYSAAIALDPLPLYYNNRGLTRQLQGKTAAAEADYLQAIALDPAYAHVYVNLAMLYSETNQPEKICDNLQKAIDNGFLPAAQLKSEYCK